jgi:hypothetical protein
MRSKYETEMFIKVYQCSTTHTTANVGNVQSGLIEKEKERGNQLEAISKVNVKN